MPKRPPKNLTFEWAHGSFDLRPINGFWKDMNKMHGTVPSDERICIAKLEDSPVAYIRFKRMTRADGSVNHSISAMDIDQNHASKGIGTALAHTAVKAYFKDNPGVEYLRLAISSSARFEPTKKLVLHAGFLTGEDTYAIRKSLVPDELPYD